MNKNTKKYLLTAFTLNSCVFANAQLYEAFPIYFENNIAEINTVNENFLINKFKKINDLNVDSITFIAYNDDTGSDEYNLKLSEKRSEHILKILQNNNLNFNINVIIKGIIKTEIKKEYNAQHITHLRNNDRRIDVAINYKGKPSYVELAQKNITTEISENLYTGDRIYLDKIIFPIDRSIITKSISDELNIIALQLKKYKNIQIEIQGHICCTKGNKDAVDKDTGKQELSLNRAKAVYHYLIKKGIEASRLRYKAYGNSKPLGFDRELDKRVEIYILKH